MRPQSPIPTYLRPTISAAAALRGSAGDGSRDGPPPPVCGSGVPGRHEDRRFTSLTDPRAYWAGGRRPTA